MPPDPEKVEALLDLEPGFVRLVTLGADAENAAGAVRLLRSRGVAVSVGTTWRIPVKSPPPPMPGRRR